MELIIYPRDDISHVALVGRLDAKGVEEMEQPFAEATAARGLPTVVDMSGITFMTSLGIGLLFSNTKKLKKAGRQLVLLNPQDMVETVLKTSKMDRVMPITYDLETAIRTIGGDPSVASGVRPSAADSAVADSPATKRSAADDILKLSITNNIAELEGLYATINQFLVKHQVPYRPGYAVNLAVEELVVNIIRYAFIDDEAHNIDIGLGILDNQIVLEIRDFGEPFDPRERPEHDVDAEDLDVGGLGLILVLDIVDLVKYRRLDKSNHVQVVIHIQADEDGKLWNVAE